VQAKVETLNKKSVKITAKIDFNLFIILTVRFQAQTPNFEFNRICFSPIVALNAIVHTSSEEFIPADLNNPRRVVPELSC